MTDPFRRAVAVLGLVTLLTNTGFSSGAAEAPPPSESRTAKILSMAQNFLLTARPICATQQCLSLLDDLALHIQVGRQKESEGWISNREEKQWRRDLSDHVLEIRAELLILLEKELATADNARKREPKRSWQSCKPQLASYKWNSDTLKPTLVFFNECATNCDRMAAAAAGICSLYAIVSPIAVVICMAATLAGYAECLDNCAAQPEQPPQN